ncbi:hypothetical protein V7S57_02480 [Caulobacter sp. CCNWLY153]|uniref:TipJ family phage tail tip protein n=1 Tax=unclassified Caulobacter TaxID=2648921 RepID=UPI002FF110E3
MRSDRCDTALALCIARDPTPEGQRTEEVQAGAAIGDLIVHAINIGALDEDEETLDLVRVYVDGEAIPFATPEERLAALDYVPAAGSIVNLQLEPAGGSNNSARTFLTVLLTAVAIVSSFTVGPFTAAMWQLAAAVVPRVLFPIRKPDTLPSANDNGAMNSQSNQIRRRGMMPLRFGAGRDAFDVAANAYTEVVNGQVWLVVIFGLHYGPCSLSDVKIGETLLSDYGAGDVQIQTFLTPGPRDFTFYANSVFQENLSDELEIGGDWETHTTAAVCDRIEIDYTWPSGLRFNKASGSIVQQEVRVQIEWAPVGTEEWQAAPLEGGPYYNRFGGVLPTGTVDVIARTQDPVRRTFAWTKDDDSQIKFRTRAWDPDGDDAEKAVQTTYLSAIRSVVFEKPVADENLSCMAMRIKSSDDLGGTLPTVTGIVTPHAPKWTGTAWLDDISQWEASDNGIAHARMMLMGPAAAKPYTAEELSDPSWEDQYELVEAMNWKGHYTLNRDVTQEDALKVLGSIGRWSAYDPGDGMIIVPNWEKPVSGSLFTGENAKDYSYTRSFPDECHGVIVEFPNFDVGGEDDEVFVPADGYSRTGGLVDGVMTKKATLVESFSLDYQVTKARAFKEGRVWLAARKLQVEVHKFTAGPDAVANVGYGHRIRVRHPEALYGAGEGRVLFRHMAGALVSGVRLNVPVTMEAGKAYGMDVRRADGVIPGMPVLNVPGKSRDVMFPAALSPELAPEAEDLIAFGELGAITEDLEIVDFEPQEDDTFQITARRYLAEQLEGSETGPIPDLGTKLSIVPKAPRPRLLGVTQATPEGVKVAFDVDAVRGGLVESFPVRWRRHAEPENQWTALTPLPSTQRMAVTPAITEATAVNGDEDSSYKVDVEIRCKLRSGDVSDALIIEGIQIGRAVFPPDDFLAAGVKRIADDGSSYPVLAVTCSAVTAGLVTELVVQVKPEGAGDDAYVSAGQALPASNPTGDMTGVRGGAVYVPRAAWRTYDGWLSDWVEHPPVAIPANSLVASDTVKAGGRPVEDILDDLSQTLINQAATDTRTAVWKSQTDEVQGSQGTSIEQLAAQTAQNTAYITFMRQVDAATGAAKWVLATNVNNHIAGIVQTNDGTLGEIYFAEDIFGIVGTDPNNPKKVFYVNTVTNKVAFRADVEIDGNLHVAGTVQTAAAADNAWTAMQVSSASSTTYGSNSEVGHSTHILTLEDDADVLFLAQINFQDGGGNSESYHSSATRIYLNGELLDQNSQGKNNAVTALPVLTSRRLPAGTHTVQLRSMCKPDDYYTSRTLVTFRAYR